MEEKIKKWSKVLKWVLVISLIWYIIGLIIELPDIIDAEKWTNEYSRQEIMEQVERYVNIEESTIILKDDIEATYLKGKSYYLYGRLAEIIVNAAIFILGFFITGKLSKEPVFDEYIYSRTYTIGKIISLSSFIIPSLAQSNSYATIILVGGFGFDILLDFYRLGCGIVVILLAYLLKQGQFLQEEYNTTI